jgi:hypothetical protein
MLLRLSAGAMAVISHATNMNRVTGAKPSLLQAEVEIPLLAYCLEQLRVLYQGCNDQKITKRSLQDSKANRSRVEHSLYT